MESAIAAMRPARPSSTKGCWSTAPKIPWVREAATPSVE